MHGYKHVIRVSLLGLILLEVSQGKDYYTDLWAVHIEGGERVAREIANRYGFTYLDQVSCQMEPFFVCCWHLMFVLFGTHTC